MTNQQCIKVHEMTQIADLTQIWHAGVASVQGRISTGEALAALQIPKPDHVIALGKAAASMAAAAYDRFEACDTLIVTKYNHCKDAPPHARIIEAAHPVPDLASLQAGIALHEFVHKGRDQMHLLCLVSGGASSLAEVLPPRMTLDDLAQQTHALLASGQDIHAMNARRKEISLIKGGKLLADYKGAQVTTLAISDVEGDDLSTIGSGIGAAPPNPPFRFYSHIVASNKIARMAAANMCSDQKSGPVISNSETLYEDIETLAPKIADSLIKSPKGIHIMGGEPTVILPPDHGIGGRNMALALNIAREIRGIDGIRVLVAGTDGTDGPTDAAGAIVDGCTWDETCL